MFSWVLSFLRDSRSTALLEACRTMGPADIAVLKAEAEFYQLDGLTQILDYGCVSSIRI